MDGFFYNVIWGDTNYSDVFKEIFYLTSVSWLHFTKFDVEDMYPYEREGYLQMAKDLAEKKALEQKKAQEETAINKGGGNKSYKVPAFK
jgi:hypothetical protein